ncbi:alanine racemase [Falsarthrobacter nasiphocae]|uniref:D-serine deaminase-like pyridoxal phosphate-dependent protein n=2 Tax=Falsarthrobacter nasiphocae TaxID=189863 RepID=A0AAE3YEG1_9MICC|nr:alanine racemase [Falsarthrobacter nasiphocae]MDR6891705.1 D-serine deaminase-like pyridoxal phosphate-dependent protein [Falsarthrobacter nasiphocae]
MGVRPDFEAYTAALADAGLAEAPIGVLDLDAFDANAEALTARIAPGAEDKTIRVASKSLRVRQAIQRAVGQPGFAGVLAFTAAEALWLVEHGTSDVVIGYPTADADAVSRIAQDERARAEITFMVDCAEHLDFLSGLASTGPLRLCLELDAGFRLESLPGLGFLPSRLRFGALRSPCFTPEDIEALAVRAAANPRVRVVGLMAYEGQVAGVYDTGRSPRAAAIRLMQRASRAEIASRRAAAVERVRRHADLEFVNGGGTGSIESTSAEDAVTEVAAGSGLFAPGLFLKYRGFQPKPAFHYAVSVVRRPGRGVVTVLGGGWTASGTPREDRAPEPVWPEGLQYAPEEWAGEVQTPLIGPAADSLHLGDLVYFRHAKAGEAAEHLNTVAVISGGRVVDQWPTYRGERKAFL